MKKSKINVLEIAKTERASITMPEFEDAMRQMMSHPDEPKMKSENREPTMQELEKRWKLER
ncbi:MAG: hypothetical protein OXD43_05890 [Bacteroidetes bacterium]|nr:hypothetical protein [Bacteroidota bacterium]